MPAAIGREDLITGFIEFAEELGRTPTATEMRAHGPHAVSTYQREFGLWNNAIKEIGYEPNHEHNVDRIEVTCAYCGEVDKVIPSRPFDGQRYFCSRKCMGQFNSEYKTGENAPKWNGGKRTIHCDNCQETFEIIPSEIGERNFCSRGCFFEGRQLPKGADHHDWKGGKVTLECAHCDEPFEVDPHEVDRRSYCSHKCYTDGRDFSGENHPNWLGGWHDYGPSWTEERKEQVRAQHDYRCQSCGKTQAWNLEEYGRRLCVHHIHRARKFDDHEKRNALSNLIPLCHGCHKKWDGIPLKPTLI